MMSDDLRDWIARALIQAIYRMHLIELKAADYVMALVVGPELERLHAKLMSARRRSEISTAGLALAHRRQAEHKERAEQAEATIKRIREMCCAEPPYNAASDLAADIIVEVPPARDHPTDAPTCDTGHPGCRCAEGIYDYPTTPTPPQETK